MKLGRSSSLLLLAAFVTSVAIPATLVRAQGAGASEATAPDKAALLAQLEQEAMSPANLKAAREVLDNALIDYRAARVKSVAAFYVFKGNKQFKKDGTMNAPILVYCGMVNAPNRLGGLTGWEMMGWTPTHVAGAASCPGNYFETGLITVTVHRIGPFTDDRLTREFDPTLRSAVQ